MNTYSISYSTISTGVIEIDAASKNVAVEIFENMSFEELFEAKDILRGLEIEDIQKY
jgi:hypothetical protein